MSNITVREADKNSLPHILRIYNQGIEDRIATLEVEHKDLDYMEEWFKCHQERYKVLVAESQDQIVGWASLNPYSHRCAYRGVAELSIYIDREFRNKGIGSLLLRNLEEVAVGESFHKIILFTLPINTLGKGLYNKIGYREVGILEKQGMMDDKYIDVMIMEKVL